MYTHPLNMKIVPSTTCPSHLAFCVLTFPFTLLTVYALFGLCEYLYGLTRGSECIDTWAGHLNSPTPLSMLQNPIRCHDHLLSSLQKPEHQYHLVIGGCCAAPVWLSFPQPFGPVCGLGSPGHSGKAPIPDKMWEGGFSKDRSLCSYIILPFIKIHFSSYSTFGPVRLLWQRLSSSFRTRACRLWTQFLPAVLAISTRAWVQFWEARPHTYRYRESVKTVLWSDLVIQRVFRLNLTEQ